jgi:hypothetical protein
MVVDDDNYEIMFEGKMYHSYEDYVEAKRSRTAGIFANSGMLAARLAIAEEMTAPGPRRAKNPCNDVAMPPLLPLRKSSRRTVSEGIDLAVMMQSSTPGAGLCGVITNGSSSMTTMRSSPLSRPGGTDRSSPAGSLLVSSDKGGNDREVGTDLVTAAGFAAECNDDRDYNDDDIGLVSSSVCSLKRCIYTINTSLSSWSQESRNFLSDFAKNIKPKKTIYWVLALCPNREKSLALGTRGLEGLDRASCPSANFNDRVLEPVAERLRAKMVYCNIRDVCIREGETNCMCATTEEAKRLAEVICVFAELAHQKEAKFIFQNCGGKSITKKLIPKIKKVKLLAHTILTRIRTTSCFTVTNAIGAFLLGNYRSIGSTST